MLSYKWIREYLDVGEMLSNLMWGYWAVIVSKNPYINFDYVAFAKVRCQFYQELKRKYLDRRKQGL